MDYGIFYFANLIITRIKCRTINRLLTNYLLNVNMNFILFGEFFSDFEFDFVVVDFDFDFSTFLVSFLLCFCALNLITVFRKIIRLASASNNNNNSAAPPVLWRMRRKPGKCIEKVEEGSSEGVRQGGRLPAAITSHTSISYHRY